MLGEIAYAMAPAQGQGGQQSPYMLSYLNGRDLCRILLHPDQAAAETAEGAPAALGEA